MRSKPTRLWSSFQPGGLAKLAETVSEAVQKSNEEIVNRRSAHPKENEGKESYRDGENAGERDGKRFMFSWHWLNQNRYLGVRIAYKHGVGSK